MTRSDPPNLPEIPGYRVLRLVAVGGFGDVYRAHQDSLDRDVAIKVSREDTSPRDLERFQREVATLREHPHSGLVPLLDSGVVGGQRYLVFPYLDGADLRQRIEEGRLTTGLAARVAQVVADAVAHLHGRGILHRDLKPSNVLFDEAGNPFLADVGLAHSLDGSRLTATGQVVGTLAYMAPEQARGAPPAPPADVYGLGLLLLEVFAAAQGLPGRDGGPHDAILMRVRPPALRALLGACLSRDPGDRPDATDVACRLTEAVARRPRAAITGTQEVPTPASPTGTLELARPRTRAPRPPRPGASWRAAPAMVAVAALALGLGALLVRPPEGPRPVELRPRPPPPPPEVDSGRLVRALAAVEPLARPQLLEQDPRLLEELADVRSPLRVRRLLEELRLMLEDLAGDAGTPEVAARGVARAPPALHEGLHMVQQILANYDRVRDVWKRAALGFSSRAGGEVFRRMQEGRQLAEGEVIPGYFQIRHDFRSFLAQLPPALSEVPLVQAWALNGRVDLELADDLANRLRVLVHVHVPRALEWETDVAATLLWASMPFNRSFVSRRIGCEERHRFAEALAARIAPVLGRVFADRPDDHALVLLRLANPRPVSMCQHPAPGPELLAALRQVAALEEARVGRWGPELGELLGESVRAP